MNKATVPTTSTFSVATQFAIGKTNTKTDQRPALNNAKPPANKRITKKVIANGNNTAPNIPMNPMPQRASR